MIYIQTVYIQQNLIFFTTSQIYERIHIRNNIIKPLPSKILKTCLYRPTSETPLKWRFGGPRIFAGWVRIDMNNTVCFAVSHDSYLFWTHSQARRLIPIYKSICFQTFDACRTNNTKVLTKSFGTPLMRAGCSAARAGSHNLWWTAHGTNGNGNPEVLICF